MQNKGNTKKVVKSINQTKLNKYRKALAGYGLKTEAAATIGCTTATLHRILRTGSGLRHTVEALEQHLN